MRWPVLLIGVVLIAGVSIFAVSFGTERNALPYMPEPVSTTSTSIFGSSTISMSTSGVQGKLNIECVTDENDPACPSQIRMIQAYQGASVVGLFKTSISGAFKADLPPGQYELRVDGGTSIRCASIGVVVPEGAFVTANLACEAGIQ